MQYLLDTNILVYVLRNDIEPAVAERLEELVANPFLVSDATVIELLGWHSHTSISYAQAEELPVGGTALPIDKVVVKRAIAIRRDISLRLGDAIIAATALVYNLVLVTRNTKDFARVEGLRLHNPFEIDK